MFICLYVFFYSPYPCASTALLCLPLPRWAFVARECFPSRLAGHMRHNTSWCCWIPVFRWKSLPHPEQPYSSGKCVLQCCWAVFDSANFFGHSMQVYPSSSEPVYVLSFHLPRGLCDAGSCGSDPHGSPGRHRWFGGGVNNFTFRTPDTRTRTSSTALSVMTFKLSPQRNWEGGEEDAVANTEAGDTRERAVPRARGGNFFFGFTVTGFIPRCDLLWAELLLICTSKYSSLSSINFFLTPLYGT